jgi:hypothetical protein
VIAILYAPAPIAWTFYPGLLKRMPEGGWLWGGDAREIDAANDPLFARKES